MSSLEEEEEEEEESKGGKERKGCLVLFVCFLFFLLLLLHKHHFCVCFYFFPSFFGFCFVEICGHLEKSGSDLFCYNFKNVSKSDSVICVHQFPLARFKFSQNLGLICWALLFLSLSTGIIKILLWVFPRFELFCFSQFPRGISQTVFAKTVQLFWFLNPGF